MSVEIIRAERKRARHNKQTKMRLGSILFPGFGCLCVALCFRRLHFNFGILAGDDATVQHDLISIIDGVVLLKFFDARSKFN